MPWRRRSANGSCWARDGTSASPAPTSSSPSAGSPATATYISFPAGLARVEPVRFAVFTFVGALPWCIALAVAGYEVGANYDRVSGPIEKAAVAVAVLVVIAIVAWIVRGRAATAGRERP